MGGHLFEIHPGGFDILLINLSTMTLFGEIALCLPEKTEERGLQGLGEKIYRHLKNAGCIPYDLYGFNA